MSTLLDQARSRVPRFAEAAVERARLTVVPRASRRSVTRVPFVALLSVLLVGGVAGLLFVNTSMQQTSFTATAMEARATALAAQQQGLQMDLDRLRDPQRVALQARRMGMIPAAGPAFLDLRTGTVLGKPTPAVADGTFRINPVRTQLPKLLNPPPVIIEKRPKKAKGATSAQATQATQGTQAGRAADGVAATGAGSGTGTTDSSTTTGSTDTSTGSQR